MKERFVLIICLFMVLLSPLIMPIYASFTDSDSNDGNIISTATLEITTTPANPTLLFNVANFVPGDTATRAATVQNSGDVDFTYQIVNSSSPGNTLLWTDTTNGLQLEIQDTDTLTVHYNGPLKDLTTSNLSLSAGQSHNLQFKITFPTSADNSFQSLSETINFTFNATQVTGSERVNQ